MEGKLKSLVHGFLTEVDPKVANMFKKNQKPKGLPTDSPGLKEIVNFYEQNSPVKGKAPRVDKVSRLLFPFCCIYLGCKMHIICNTHLYSFL
jgi:hypothetical protein